MTAWIVILLAGLGSYLFRISMVVLTNRVALPAKVEQASEFVAPAAFAALAATGIAAASVQAGDVAQAIPLLAAVAVAIVAVRLTGRSYVAVLAGMPTLWLLSLAVGT
ncbi:MAG TPA: AzlD domain-containing protein [Jiangellaceae bacterium]|nr:AzlD domain-containing protein [Jiangellaceae bacterium]